MALKTSEQKRIELWFLNAARHAGVPIPFGEVPGEEPDFRFQTTNGVLGIELSEVLRPESSNWGILPVQEESFHQEVLQTAQRKYYAMPNARPVHVSVYFSNARGKKCSMRQMSDALSGFVLAHVDRASPALCCMGDDAPDGFDSVVMVPEPNPKDWWAGDVGGITLSEIRPQVEARIAAKDKLVQSYRSNLAAGAQLWLLLHTGVTVARSMPIPHGIEEWRIPFRFDKVFWFASLEGQFAEIRRKDL